MRRPADRASLDGELDDEGSEEWSEASSDEEPDGGEMQLVPGTDAEGNPVGVWMYNGVPFFGIIHEPA